MSILGRSTKEHQTLIASKKSKTKTVVGLNRVEAITFGKAGEMSSDKNGSYFISFSLGRREVSWWYSNEKAMMSEYKAIMRKYISLI